MNFLQGISSNLLAWSTAGNQTPSTTEVASTSPAFAALKDLADKGDVIAQHRVSIMYETGGDGVGQDLTQAMAYQQKALQQTQAKVNFLAMKIKQQETVVQTQVKSVAPAAISATSAVAPNAITTPAVIKAGFINLSSFKETESLFFISQQLNALGITLSPMFLDLNEVGTAHDLEFMIIDSCNRGFEAIMTHETNMCNRFELMKKSPVPLLVIMVTGSKLKLQVMFCSLPDLVEDAKKKHDGELRNKLGDGEPLDILVAPLLIQKPESVQPLDQRSIDSHKEEYAKIRNDPNKLRAFMVKVLTDSLKVQK